MDRQLRAGTSPKTVLTEMLTPCGYIPTVPTAYPSDRQLGFINHHNQWEEWDVPSVSYMRAYWARILPPAVQADPAVMSVLQSILDLVPTRSVTCTNCHWEIPVNSMYSSAICCFCQEQNHLHHPRDKLHTAPTRSAGCR